MKRKLLTTLGLLGSVALAACSDGITDPAPAETAQSDRSAHAVRGAPAGQEALRPGGDAIAQIAIDEGFDELVSALQYVDAELDAGLVDLFLNGTDQYTVFAPTNAAFDNLYTLLSDVLESDIDEITDVPAPVVFDVLLYHVAEGRRASNSVVPPRRVRTISTLGGETFHVRTDASIEDGLTGIRPDDASVVTADISASNGIIHVIDQVLVPASVVAALTS